MIYVVLGIVLLILIWFFVTFNNFIKLENKIIETFATMDVYLKKRWDLIPNLVEIVKGYAKHEKGILEEVTKLRSGNYNKFSEEEKLNANERITKNIGKILALAENYPQLKSNDNFISLSEELVNIENEIAQSRKYYNASVRLFNNKVKMIPSNVVAKIFGYKEKKMFEATDDERNNLSVSI